MSCGDIRFWSASRKGDEIGKADAYDVVDADLNAEARCCAGAPDILHERSRGRGRRRLHLAERKVSILAEAAPRRSVRVIRRVPAARVGAIRIRVRGPVGIIPGSVP